jgi:hypothetical protein
VEPVDNATPKPNAATQGEETSKSESYDTHPKAAAQGGYTAQPNEECDDATAEETTAES